MLKSPAIAKFRQHLASAFVAATLSIESGSVAAVLSTSPAAAETFWKPVCTPTAHGARTLTDSGRYTAVIIKHGSPSIILRDQTWDLDNGATLDVTLDVD